MRGAASIFSRNVSRRRFFNWAVHGLGATALTNLLGAQPDHIPRAKRGINICLVGGLSQIDSFDYKPDLAKHHGQAPGIKNIDPFFGKVGRIRKNESHVRFDILPNHLTCQNR